MKGFAFAAAAGSLRGVLAMLVASLAILGTVYFGGHKLSNPDHYSAVGGGLCNRTCYVGTLGGPPRPARRSLHDLPA
jgi:hypothetical protein